MASISKHIILLTLARQIIALNISIPKTIKPLFLFFSILTISVCTTNAFAQYTYELDKTTRFEKMGAEEGLSTGYATCMHQDKYGFIWIGSQFGLNLYDGYNVKVFNIDPSNPSAIYNNRIISIFEEPDGTMWFCTAIGISKYNRATQTFTNYIPDTANVYKDCNYTQKILPDGDQLWVDVWEGLLLFDKNTGLFQSLKEDTINPSQGVYSNMAYYTFMDRSGNLWVSSWDANKKLETLSKYDKSTGKFIHFLNNPADPESFNGKAIVSMIEDRDGILWIATRGGGLLEIIDKDKGKFKHYLHDENDQYSLLDNDLSTVFEDSKGNIWTGGKNGFSKLEKNTSHFRNYTVPRCSFNKNRINIIYGFTEDTDGELWLNSNDGVFRFNSITQKLRHYFHDQGNQNSISGNYVNQIMQDHSGQIWISELNTGINKLNDFSNSIRKVEKNITNKFTLSSNYVGQILMDARGNLWVGGRDGLTKIKLNKTKKNNKLDHNIFELDEPEILMSTHIIALYEDKRQTIWIGTFGGLFKYDHNKNNLIRYMPDTEYVANSESNDVESIFEDSHGTLWVGTRDGLNIMNRSTGKVFAILPDNKNAVNTSLDIRAIYEDIYGDVWFGGDYLYKLNRKDTSLIDFIPNTGITNDIYRTGIRRIGEDGLGNLWFTTNRGGLYKMHRIDTSFTSLTVDDGLPRNSVMSLETDDNGDIWVSTSNGIARINHQDYSIRTFDISDGLISLEFLNKSSYKDKDGWLYFGGRKGFNVFHPDSIKENKHIPPVYITGLNIAREPRYFEDVIFNMDHVELQYNENDFSFDFVALSYINPQKNLFAYMLEGYDKDWIYAGNKRTANYTKMSPGDYTFKVKASNNNGYWNEEGASIALVIHPPFWKTWWAYSIYALIIISLFYILRRNELKRLKLRRELEFEQVITEKLIEVDKEKSDFFANVSHEFRTPLTLILGPISKVISILKDGNNKQELLIAHRSAIRLQTLINQLLSLSKLESGKMKLKVREENIVQLVKVFVGSFESLANQKQIELIFDSSLENYQLMIDRLKVEKILNNLLSNAFKFTEQGGMIKVSISSKSGGIQIKVSDTGIGIREEDLEHIFNRFYQVDSGHSRGYEGTGIGLALTKELLELHHGSIKVESEVDVGTTVIIFLPAGKEHLNKNELISKGSPDHKEDVELFVDDYVYGNIPLPDISSGSTTEQSEKILPFILIVEDNSDMRAYLKGYLEQSYKIIIAENGEDGFYQATEHIPDLIITDLMMPKMDGNELTEKLKLDQRTSHIPVIMLTAKATMESKLEGLETGADDFLTKPFDAQELIIRIRNLINQRQKLRAMFRQQIDNADQANTIQEYTGIGISTIDKQFIEKAINVVEDYYSNPDFGVELFANEMAMSRVHLHRKLTSLIDYSPNNYIRNIRLTKAAELLKEGELNVTQVSYEVGIFSLSHFAKAFKEKYGVSPSEYS